MKEQVIDNRGLACPQPVINTRKALTALTSGYIVSLVDNYTAKENVMRLAQSLGCTCEVEEQGELYYIRIFKGDPVESAVSSFPEREEESWQKQKVILIKDKVLGQENRELGELLMRTYLYTLSESPRLPLSIILLHGGTHLATADSPVLPYLQRLEENGVEVVLCGICVDFLGVKDQLRVGRIGNMYEICELTTQYEVVSL